MHTLVTITAGMNSAEAQDWVRMLVRMYARWAEEKGYEARVIGSSPGEVGGLRNAVLAIAAAVHGRLSHEVGVHRLTYISPFDPHGRRHTVMAAVAVTAEPGELPAEEELSVAAAEFTGRKFVFSAPIRSYILQPYSLVKDHRTGIETGDATRVLDGAIDQFRNQEKP